MRIRESIFSIFTIIVKPFLGTNITRFRPLSRIYRFLYMSLRPKKPVIIEGEGGKMYVDFTALSATPSYMFGDKYKPLTRELFRRGIKPGMTVVDLGAHIGYFTLLAAKLVGEQGNVFAFEPAPDTYALLTKNIALNGYDNVVAVQKAVLNKAGQVKLFLSRYDSMFHNIYGFHNEGEKFVLVDAISLDKFLMDKDLSINFIKMDVEGAEMAALEGMSNLIKRNHNLAIVTEYAPEFLSRASSSPEVFLNKMVNYGFKFYIIHEEEQYLERRDAASLIKAGLVDLLCVRGEPGITIYEDLVC